MAYALSMLTCACSLSADVITVPVDGAAALLLIAQDERSAIALELSAQPAFVSVPAKRNQTYYALRFDCGLAPLGLVPGPLTLTETGRPLPKASSIIRADATLEDWEALDAPPEFLQNLRIDTPPPRCPNVLLKTTPLQTQGIRFIAPLNSGFLLQTDSGELYELAEGLTPLPELSQTVQRVVSAVDGPNGERWIFDAEGNFYRTQNTELNRGPSLPQTQIRWMRAQGGGTPYELFALTDSGDFLRFDEGAWLSADALEPLDLGRAFDLLYLEPGHALAVDGIKSRSIRWKDDRLSIEPFEAQLPQDRPVTLGSTNGRVMLGTRAGALYEARDGRWSAREGHPARVLAIVPLSTSGDFGPDFMSLDEAGGVRFGAADNSCPLLQLNVSPASTVSKAEGAIFWASETSEGAALYRLAPAAPGCESSAL